MGRNSKILEAFMLFIHEKINREDYINMLKENIKNSNKFKKHIQKLIEDLDYYDPNILNSFFMRGHFTTNSIEGLFGNIKTSTNHNILPLHEIIKIFINQANQLMKNNLMQKHINLS